MAVVTVPRCLNRQCKKRAEIENLCITHAERKADTKFSLRIRERDRRCTAKDILPGDCHGVLQAAHIVGRRNHAVRYDPENVHALCARHHYTVDQHGQEGAKYVWASRLLGEDGWERLMARSQRMGNRRESVREALR